MRDLVFERAENVCARVHVCARVRVWVRAHVLSILGVVEFYLSVYMYLSVCIRMRIWSFLVRKLYYIVNDENIYLIKDLRFLVPPAQNISCITVVSNFKLYQASRHRWTLLNFIKHRWTILFSILYEIERRYFRGRS